MAPPKTVSKARALVARMSTEEKATLLSGNGWWATYPVERLGIPALTMNDGPHGIRKSQPGAIDSTVRATCFPTASALAATWNTDLLLGVGAAIGKEARAHDVRLLLGPGINMKRSPLCGRNFEYFSEDPHLAGKLAVAYILGLQGEGVGATLKHFAVNSQEFERMVNSSNVDERTLHEIYLRAFEMAVTEARPWAIMCAYNKVNGIHASEHEELLTRILRQQWGFDGFVMSDWGAVNDRVRGVQSGLNLEMPGSGTFNRDKIIRAVESGELSPENLDRSVTELLAVVLQSQAQFKPLPDFDADRHHQLARAVAGESIVLLKNGEGILPLKLKRGTKLAVIGRFAKEPRFQGAGSSQVKPTQVSTAYDELVTLTKAQHLSYAPGYNEDGTTDTSLLNEARNAARVADVAVIFAGLPDSYESEGFDRSSLDLPVGHNELIFEVAKAQPNTVVVLINGAAVTMPWLDRIPGLLEAWLGGQAGGAAIADALLGRINPSGKLAETFPRRLEDTPTGTDFPGRNGVSEYGERLLIGYRHYDTRKIEPLFPFGFGLSYTRFWYEKIKASATTLHLKNGKPLQQSKEVLTLEVTLRNTGRVAGKEVVQLYLHPRTPCLMRPEQELKAFTKVELQPGEQRTVTLALTARDFTVYDPTHHGWILHPGELEIRVGGCSRDLPLRERITVHTSVPLRPLTRESMLKEFRDHPKGAKFYPELLAAMGANLREPDPAELAALTPSERSERKKAHTMMMTFIHEFPVGKIP
ncbi:MAG: glycoside hydrolase family 3 C-terminal domain-containing protein, partial [Limisphaerales bacterium]